MNENKILFYGASDDCVEFEGYIEDEFYLDTDGWRGYLISPSGQKLELHADYVREWVLGAITTSGEPVEFPLRFTHRPGRPLDPAIEITVPDGTQLVIPDLTEG